MMGGMDGGRRLLEKDALKPKNVSATLKRFWIYFSQRWWALVLVLVLLVINTWSQVIAPDIIGQSVDCYLFPVNSASCWYDPGITASSPTDVRLAGLLGDRKSGGEGK